MSRVDDIDARLREVEEHGSIPARHIRRRQLAAYVLVVIAAACGLYLNRNLASQIDDQQKELVSGLVQSCEQNGNPLRTTVQQILQDQIDQTHAVDFSKFFPQIPPAQLHHLIHAQNQTRRQEIRQIAPVDCAALYR